MSTQPGNFTLITTTVTPSFASTSGGFEVNKSQPGQSATFSKPETGFSTATTSFFRLNYNDSPSSFTINSPTGLPVVTTTFSHLAQGKMTPSSTQSSSNTNLTNANIESGAMNINADLTEAVIKFTPVSGTDTFKINGVNLIIQTRNHCQRCMKNDQIKHSEKFPSQNDAKDQRAGFNVHPSPSGGISNSSLGMSSVTLTSENSGISRQSGADDSITVVSDSFAPFQKEEKMKTKTSSFQRFRKKVEMKVKGDILKQAEESSDAQATSSASILASNNEFDEFVSTSATNKTNASCAGDTKSGIDSKTTMIQDEFNKKIHYEIQQLASQLRNLQLDLKTTKKPSPSRGIKKTHLQEDELHVDTLLQQEQEKNKKLTEDIVNMIQQNLTLMNHYIELKNTIVKRFDQIQDALKNLINGNSINHSKEDSENKNEDENENEDKNEKDDEIKKSDTEEVNDEEKTPELERSSSSTFQLTPQFVTVSEADYLGPKLEDGKVTLKFMEELQKCYKEQRNLHVNYATKILSDVERLLASQPSLVDIEIPDNGKFTICGDIHGQYFDLLGIFKINGFPSPSNPYLFNGDIVDRGAFSVECILTLFGYKLLYPNHVFIGRGNHEAATLNAKYGFEDEVNTKYTNTIFPLFTKTFNRLPLAHCFNKKVLVMHGGLFSRDDVTLDEIRKINRNKQPPETGVMCELLWSDPRPQRGRSSKKRFGRRGIKFGPDITKKFLEINGLDFIIRSHEVQENGNKICHDGKCITIFSAPNYCDNTGNKGAIIILHGQDLSYEFISIEASPHPVPLSMIKNEKRYQEAFKALFHSVHGDKRRDYNKHKH